jgi:hypothetical protein
VGFEFPRGMAVQGSNQYSGTAAPTSGNYPRGSIVWNTAPSAAGKVGWVCTAAGWIASSGWVGNTDYAVGALVLNDTGKSYKCLTAGKSAASGGPTGTGANITDGTAHWAYSPGFTFKPFGAIDA